MSYIENPKTKDSGIICCIPHNTTCPIKCEDCFFISGRSYLEPLQKNLPNMPSFEEVGHRIVRVNDGNDSNNKQQMVIDSVKHYKQKFYNTSITKNLNKFDAPFVLTLNPGKYTDVDFAQIEPIPSLMFVRLRVNTWNLDLVDDAVEYYSEREVPIVLTFMAYFKGEIPEAHIEDPEKSSYIFRKRTLNEYWAIKTDSWRGIMNRYADNKWVYSCGKIEGERGVTGCRYCGNCVREYHNSMERMR